ncbi:MAG: SDR family oxidoreductase [Bacteroidota bacterium]
MSGISIGNDQKYLLTGATGFLGCHIMAGLLLKGQNLVITGRPSGGQSLKQRIRQLLKWFGIAHLEGLLEYYETDFLKPMLGLGMDEYTELGSRGLSIIHCASDTSFAERDREKVMKSNVESLTEILNFANRSRTNCFYFISSAYAAGTDNIECPEASVSPAHFYNVYEESKAHAEQIVSGRCREGGLPYTIIRPSVVYGNSLTGRSLKFNAMYYPVRSMLIIRDIYLNDIKHNNGTKSAECGIHINCKGELHLPVRIFIPTEGKINLIPVNYFTETLLTLIEKPANGKYYHISSNNPVSMATLVAYTRRFLNISGIEVVIGMPGSEEMRNPPEELFDHFIKAYRPYISDKRTFRRTNTDNETGGSLPPDLSYEVFERCMTYAVSAEWGKNLFKYSDSLPELSRGKKFIIF